MNCVCVDCRSSRNELSDEEIKQMSLDELERTVRSLPKLPAYEEFGGLKTYLSNHPEAILVREESWSSYSSGVGFWRVLKVFRENGKHFWHERKRGGCVG